MLSLPSPQSPTTILGEYQRITAVRFKQLLASKDSPALAESDNMYNDLGLRGVDAAFALAQFRVESQYGTAGYAAITGSFGNMLYDSNLTILASGTYKPGNGYTYATYDTYMQAVQDYIRYIYWYIDRYDLTTIYGATARWIGKTPGSSGHLNYVNTIVNDMIEYQYPNGGYNTGDKMIYAGPSFDRKTGRITQKYPVTVGMELYRSTNGDLLKKYSGTPGNAWWLGFPNNDPAWGALFIGTTLADPDATVVYVRNPVKSRIITL